jgi:SET domain-containing protein
MARKRPFRIGRSRTGLGLFATEPIRKRTRIIEYKGRKLPNDEAEQLEARGNRYLYEINSRWTIDGSTRSNLGRYANHSCRPNAESYHVGHRMFLRAVKNIKPGDEITYDYGIDYLNNVITRRGCKCDKCRNQRAEARARLRAKARRAKVQRARRKAEQARLSGQTCSVRASPASAGLSRWWSSMPFRRRKHRPVRRS